MQRTSSYPIRFTIGDTNGFSVLSDDGTTVCRFDTQNGKRASSRWKTLDGIIWRVTAAQYPESNYFPLSIESITNANGDYEKTILTLTTAINADIFYQKLMIYDQTIATSGTSLLIQIDQAETEEALAAIIDTRTIPYIAPEE